MGYYLTHNTTWDRLLGSDGQYLPPAAFKGGLGWNRHRPPLSVGLQKQNPLLKNQIKIKIILELGNPTPGRINSDLKLVYNITTSTTYKFRSKTSI